MESEKNYRYFIYALETDYNEETNSVSWATWTVRGNTLPYIGPGTSCFVTIGIKCNGELVSWYNKEVSQEIFMKLAEKRGLI